MQGNQPAGEDSRGFPGQTVVDAFILVLTSAFCIIGTAHIMLLWQMRNDFFIILRSPLLACVSGLCIILPFTCTMYLLILEGGAYEDGVNLITYPAWWIAQAALVFTALRLLVMYYPSKKVKYGRYVNEKRLVRALGYAYVLIEVLGWSSAAVLGKERTASVVVSMSPPLAFLTIIAAAVFYWQLKDVDDFSNMGRDIRLVGAALLGSSPIYLAIRLFTVPDSMEGQYGRIAFMMFSHVPVVWILNVKPVRENRRQESGFTFMPLRRSMSLNNVRVAVTAGAEKSPRFQRSRTSCEDSSRLASIMTFEPLRAAFGDFCYKCLCGESFQFLVDVFDFKNEVLLEAEESDERARIFKGFGGYLAIVNDYIADGSHSEVNIDFRTKQDILKCAKFAVYSSLDMSERRELFSVAEKAVSKVLMDNLLNKFVSSRQYQAVVDLD